jgi:TusA-related sulfurtransferase
MKIVDTKGQLCPVPLIMTKKTMNEIGENENLLIIIDNDTSYKNVSRFLEEHKMTVSTKRNGNLYELTVNKTGHIPEST